MGLTDALQPGPVYLDANLLIYHLEGVPRLGSAVGELMHEIETEAIEALTSELAVAEALVKPFQSADPERAADPYLRLLAEESALRVVSVSTGMWVEARANAK